MQQLLFLLELRGALGADGAVRVTSVWEGKSTSPRGEQGGRMGVPEQGLQQPGARSVC